MQRYATGLYQFPKRVITFTFLIFLYESLTKSLALNELQNLVQNTTLHVRGTQSCTCAEHNPFIDFTSQQCIYLAFVSAGSQICC